MRVKLKTLGCRLNEAELETWARQFQAAGHRIVPDAGEADLVVLNSCAVTHDAERKSRSLIRRLHRENPAARLVVTGCHASMNPKETGNALGVDLVVANADKDRLVEIAQQALDMPAMPAFSTEPGETALFALGRQRAFVKVQDGCRHRCTFCVVTLARGEEKSRPVAEVVAEINALHEQGVEEFVLTGVHLGGWGGELGLRLDDLLRAVLEDTGARRLRLGSLEPWELSERFFEFWQNPRLMPHLHLPLQSGSDAVLRRMARRCKTAEFAELARQARAACPDMNITTDIIVGFPGETDALWQEGLAFIDSLGFGHIHIFAYSPRAGTKAAELPGRVPEPVKKARAQELQKTAERHKRTLLAGFLGRDMAVLWEAGGEALEDGSRRFKGFTPNYLRVETLAPPGRDLCRQIAGVRLAALGPDYLIGELAD